MKQIKEEEKKMNRGRIKTTKGEEKESVNK